MQKLFFVLPFLLLGLFLFYNLVFAQTDLGSNNTSQDKTPSIQVTANSEGRLQTIIIPSSKLIFDLNPNFGNNGNLFNFKINLKPSLGNLYKQIGPQSNLKTVFVYPIFTQAAYQKNGFYDHYQGKCDNRCLTVNIPQPSGYYSSSGIGSVVLYELGFPFVTDVDIDKNPDILKKYDRVIVLHNEYVTEKEFDAITSHPDVVFLYPNALYAEVSSNYTSNTITLLRGHGYPDQSIKNGFGWKDDNSKYEYSVFCTDWTFYRKDNYSMLNCYPEYKILYAPEMLIELQKNDPTELLTDTTNWLRFQDKTYAHIMLADYDINGTIIPPWVGTPILMEINGDITKSELLELLDYLYQNNIIR